MSGIINIVYIKMPADLMQLSIQVGFKHKIGENSLNMNYRTGKVNFFLHLPE
jgi:hypothetical protein